ncbi:YdeI/OmpD-associated family protein [Polyangium jinanense]|uniref:YdeI/OmpD-associated family protein n=1 Tax=Polyangium jinanense TaxID=2829994 RepID=A0A9X3XF58_9BACT|nr:YdeI/OmpD-associated family protein [Polyangium jinanense]MDC3961786.1 YdeI/OmpD-associated family protein [Polyangium jinanense]MDC3988320.1 YdeI/OmpD-associated family protein [Polyangium jinanense]MDC3989517.1 YdeI/OmpD-associated family protein [Polyangium jinanense]
MTTTSSPLSKKLQIKPDTRVLLLGAPDGRADLLEPLPEGASVSTAARGSFDVVVLFVEKAKELEKGGLKAISAVRQGGVLWIAYPKKSSKVETDLTRDVGWNVIEEAGWGGVAQVAIDETWSALRFKPEATVARKENSAAAPGAMKKRAGAAKKTANVPAPADLAAALAKSSTASMTWDALAPSHRKEYVGWIEEAKKPETRARRISSAVEMLAAGIRDRNAKYAR